MGSYTDPNASGLEPFQVKWIRFAVEKASKTKTRADSMPVETALGTIPLGGALAPGAITCSAIPTEALDLTIVGRFTMIAP
jgi:hypothetical protein